MINKFRFTPLLFVSFITFSCSGWNLENNPVENSAKGVKNFFEKISGKNELKYSTLNKDYERNRADYYKENLDNFLGKHYKKDEYESFYNFKIDLNNKSKAVELKKIYQEISNHCVSGKENFPKFHKVAGDKNILKQTAIYSKDSQKNFEREFGSKDVKNYLGVFSCFKRNIGTIWKVAIKADIEETKRVVQLKINPYADYTNTQRERRGGSACTWCVDNNWLKE